MTTVLPMPAMSFKYFLGWMAKTALSGGLGVVFFVGGAMQFAQSQPAVGTVMVILGGICLLYALYNRDIKGREAGYTR